MFCACTDVFVQEAPDSWYLRGVVAPDDHLQPPDLDLRTLGGEQPGVRPTETLHHLYIHMFTLYTKTGVHPAQTPPITSIYKLYILFTYIHITYSLE